MFVLHAYEIKCNYKKFKDPGISISFQSLDWISAQFWLLVLLEIYQFYSFFLSKQQQAFIKNTM